MSVTQTYLQKLSINSNSVKSNNPKKSSPSSVTSINKIFTAGITTGINTVISIGTACGMITSIQSPRIESPRVQSSRIESPRVQSSRIESPRIQTPRVNTQNSIQNVTKLSPYDNLKKIYLEFNNLIEQRNDNVVELLMMCYEHDETLRKLQKNQSKLDLTNNINNNISDINENDYIDNLINCSDFDDYMEIINNCADATDNADKNHDLCMNLMNSYVSNLDKFDYMNLFNINKKYQHKYLNDDNKEYITNGLLFDDNIDKKISNYFKFNRLNRLSKYEIFIKIIFNEIVLTIGKREAIDYDNVIFTKYYKLKNHDEIKSSLLIEFSEKWQRSIFMWDDNMGKSSRRDSPNKYYNNLQLNEIKKNTEHFKKYIDILNKRQNMFLKIKNINEFLCKEMNDLLVCKNKKNDMEFKLYSKISNYGDKNKPKINKRSSMNYSKLIKGF
jgi:hypothetical protein